MDQAEITLQRQCDDYVRQNVNCCLSSLVATLASGSGHVSHRTRDYPHEGLIEQAAELASPVEDYEEAARQAGYLQSDAENGAIGTKEVIDSGNFDATFSTWEDACASMDLDPYQWEVYEHWAISDYMADALEYHGEKVDRDFAGLVVWARTTTGQAISMDGVIRAIVCEIQS